MREKWKNAVGILLIVVVAAAIVGGVTVAALDHNKKTTDVEYFIDEAPYTQEYRSEENVLYVKRFRDTITGLLSFSTDAVSLDVFADRLLQAAALARIPAYKLDGIASAIKKADPEAWVEGILSLDEEALQKIAEKSTLSIVRDLLADFLAISDLTTREAADFLYEYLALFGKETYKVSLGLVGKDAFIDFVGATLFLIDRTSHFNEDGSLPSSALLAAFYEYGELFKQAFSAGNDAFSTVFGLVFDRLKEEVNEQMAFINEKTGYLFCLVGYLFSDVSSATAENIIKGNFDGSDTDAYSVLAQDLSRGIDRFLAEQGENAGIADRDELSAVAAQYLYDFYTGYYIHSSVDVESEEIKEDLRARRDRTTAFFEALNDLASDNGTAEDVAAFVAFYQETRTYFETFIYLWTVQRMSELNEEAI